MSCLAGCTASAKTATNIATAELLKHQLKSQESIIFILFIHRVYSKQPRKVSLADFCEAEQILHHPQQLCPRTMPLCHCSLPAAQRLLEAHRGSVTALQIAIMTLLPHTQLG